jgi:hypothetical protein
MNEDERDAKIHAEALAKYRRDKSIDVSTSRRNTTVVSCT